MVLGNLASAFRQTVVRNMHLLCGNTSVYPLFVNTQGAVGA